MTYAAWPQNYEGIPRSRRYLFSDLLASPSTLTGCTAANNSSIVKAATNSVAVTPSASPPSTIQIGKNITALGGMNLRGGNARIRLYYADTSGTTYTFAILLSNGTGTTNAHRFAYNTNILRPGWNYLYLPLANRDPSVKPLGYSTTVNGTGFDYTQTCNYIQCNLDTSPAQSAVIYYDSIDVGIRSRAKIILGFDDADQSIVDYALPVLSGYGWTGYLAMAQVYTGAPEIAAIATLKAAGWHVINHSRDHVSYTSMTLSEVIQDYQDNRAFCQEQGFYDGQPDFTRNLFVYPNNATNAAVTQALVNQGCIMARGVQNSHFLPDTYGIDVPQNIGSISLTPTDTLASRKAHVDFAVSQGATLFIFGHELYDGVATGLQWPKADYEALCAHIRTYEKQGLLDVVSWADYYQGLTQPTLVV